MPMFKGVKTRKANHLGWRHADPSRDKNLRGQPIEENYIVIVRIKECRLYEEDGKDMYDPKDAPAIPQVHSRTNASYGKSRTRNGRAWFYESGLREVQVVVSKYISTPYYYVHSGVVYQGTVRKAIRGEKGKIMHVIARYPKEVGDTEQ